MGPVLLALREIRRSKGRFGLLTGAVGVLVFLIVFQQALLNGLVDQFVGAIRNQSAEVLVYGEDARVNLQGSVVRPDTVQGVGRVDGVATAGPLGVATVTVVTGDELEDATVFGHLLDGPGGPVELSEGRRPERDGEAVATAGTDGFRVGDRLVVVPGDIEVAVVGVAEGTSFSVTPTLFVSYATYEDIQLAANPDATAAVPSAVAVLVDDGEDAAAVADRITAEVEGVEAATRARAADEAPGVESVSQSLGVVLLLTYAVATIIIGFFFLILTVQKRATLTLLRAVGAPAGGLVGSLAVQVLAVLAGGLVLGAGVAMLALRVASTGIDATVEPSAFLTTVAALVVLAGLACIGAGRRIARLDPAAATLPGVGAR